MISITQKWLEEGELCIRGVYKGFEFAAHHGDTDTDYGWHELNYLPQYSNEGWDMPDDIYDELDEAINQLDVWAIKEAL
jgi:hypothetical protein